MEPGPPHEFHRRTLSVNVDMGGGRYGPAPQWANHPALTVRAREGVQRFLA
jgi:hypothetical protein